jgi:hypothetical protein
MIDIDVVSWFTVDVPRKLLLCCAALRCHRTGMSYMASMINLPIFLEQACGLTPAFIGMLIFVRPGFGSMMSTFLGRVMGKPDHWLTKHRMVKIGSAIALLSYCVLAAGAQLIAAAPTLAGPIVIFTLFLQASGSFSVFLGGNAIVLERVPEENLSNVSAIRNMMSQMASTMAAAVGLSVVRDSKRHFLIAVSQFSKHNYAGLTEKVYSYIPKQVRLGGSPSDPRAYYPLWAMLISLAGTTMWLAFCGLGDGNTPSSGDNTATHQHATPTTVLESATEEEGDNDDEEMPMLGYHNGNGNGKQHSGENKTSKAVEINGSSHTPLEPRP